MSILKVLFCCTVITMLSCGVSPLAGNGTGTDIGEAKISGCVKLSGNIPGENVTITLRKQDYIPFSTLVQNQERTVSDKNGVFTISQPEMGYYLVELENKDSLCAIKRFYISNSDSGIDLGNCTIDTPAIFSGKVFTDGTPAASGKMLVLGMDKKVTLEKDGSFSLRLPSGEQLLRVITKDDGSTSDVLFNDQNSGDTIQFNSTPITMFDDFENRDGLNSLTSLLGGGSWFAFTDVVNGGGSRILPTSEPGLVAAIDSTSGAYKGGSLHCTFQIDQTFSAPYALIGVDFSNSKDINSSKSWFDLTKMTAFSFMAKGSGTVYVQFTCKPTGISADYIIYEIPIYLSSGWNKCTIRASDIPNAISPSSIPWKSANIAVSNINFLAKSGTDLWLDNLIIEGINATDFLK